MDNKMREEIRRELYESVVLTAPTQPILDMLSKIHWALGYYENIMVGISGGSDSDTMLDAFRRLDFEKKIIYAYFGTGMEYEAVKRHLKELEAKYQIKIETLKPVLPIPTCCRKYGVPFWSKHVSEMMSRLQRHGFKWEDKPFDVLIKEYPRARAALRWWCNDFPKKKRGGESSFNIGYVPWLKEFLIANPPPMLISAMCCTKAKKEPAHKYEKEMGFDLVCSGVRKVEGGIRSVAYTTCHSFAQMGKAATYRPLFWLTDKDKLEYKEHYELIYSDCYEVWGMRRTGCPGCPFGKEFEQELDLMQKYEPKFHRAAEKIFGASYEYTRRFIKFREEMQAKKKEEEKGNQCD